MPTEDDQGAALAREAKALGARRVDVVSDGGYGQLVSVPFEAAARRLGLKIAGTYNFDPAAKRYAGLARRVARDRPDAVLVAGLLDENAGAVVRDLRRRLGPQVDLIGGDALLPISVLFARAGASARGVHVSFPGLDPRHLGAEGRAFVRAFGASQQGPVNQAAVYAAAAAELALDAIAHSGGTRKGVLEALRRSHPPGILGVIHIDARGDIRPVVFTIVRAARAGGSDAVVSTEGAIWERALFG
jgi:ABC-type branched-subunit amino acid transport system substrate-binding protein